MMLSGKIWKRALVSYWLNSCKTCRFEGTFDFNVTDDRSHSVLFKTNFLQAEKTEHHPLWFTFLKLCACVFQVWLFSLCKHLMDSWANNRRRHVKWGQLCIQLDLRRSRHFWCTVIKCSANTAQMGSTMTTLKVVLLGNKSAFSAGFYRKTKQYEMFVLFVNERHYWISLIKQNVVGFFVVCVH